MDGSRVSHSVQLLWYCDTSVRHLDHVFRTSDGGSTQSESFFMIKMGCFAINLQ